MKFKTVLISKQKASQLDIIVNSQLKESWDIIDMSISESSSVYLVFIKYNEKKEVTIERKPSKSKVKKA